MNDDEDSGLVASICDALRSGSDDVTALLRALPGPRAFEVAAQHGVLPLLTHHLARAGVAPAGGDAGGQPGTALRDGAARELIHARELTAALDALAGAGVEALLLKGAALAYWLYPWPSLRPRADTDLMIRESHRQPAEARLAALGYRKPNAVSGSLVSYQCSYVKTDALGVEHVLDLHWRISNAQILSGTMDYESLAGRAIAVTALGTHARGLAPVDALLHACTHRAQHMHSPLRANGTPHGDGDRLIWLYDIHLLVNAMTPAEHADVARLAAAKGVRVICRDALLQTQRRFDTRLDADMMGALSEPGPREPSESLLRAGEVSHLVGELRSLERWRDRARLLREHLVPPADYMLRKYSATSPAWLPLLYVRRGLSGAWRRLVGS